MRYSLVAHSLLITGGAAPFGHAFFSMALEKYNPKKLTVFSRDEMERWEIAKRFST